MAGPLVVRSQDMRSGVFRTEEAGHVSVETYRERIARAEPQHGDLVYSREGTYFGIAAELPPGVQVCLGQRMVLLRPKREKINFRFLRYWLNSPVMAGHTNGQRDGSVAERLNMPTIRGLPVVLPPPPEQIAIASVLGALDDKIESNRRTSQILEELASALFRSWFVDFDPVVAKAAGRKPSHLRPEIAALFPDIFQDSELGLIPRKWSVNAIGDAVTVVGGSTPSTNEPKFWDGEIAWATPRDLAALSEPVLITTDRKITLAGLNQIGSGLLPKGTVLLSSRAPIGYTAISDMPIAINQGFIALICDGTLPSYYAIEWVKENMSTIEGNANGTTFMEISKKNFRPILTVIPPPAILEKFLGIVTPWWGQIIHNVRESHTLAVMRDTLLPKLLSGELRVKQAEKLVEAKI